MRVLFRRFYKLYDNLIREFTSSLDSKTIVIVVSDHGIGSRPVKLININELLRRNNLLLLKKFPRNENTFQNHMTKIKKSLLRIIDQNDLGNIAAIALRIFPKGKEWFISSDHIDWENSCAYLTDQSGIKNYPYGGIKIILNHMTNYEEIRDQIIKELSAVRDPITDEGIVKWICRREQLYSGEYLDRYPDLLFELHEKFGAGIQPQAPFLIKVYLTILPRDAISNTMRHF